MARNPYKNARGRIGYGDEVIPAPVAPHDHTHESCKHSRRELNAIPDSNFGFCQPIPLPRERSADRCVCHFHENDRVTARKNALCWVNWLHRRRGLAANRWHYNAIYCLDNTKSGNKLF